MHTIEPNILIVEDSQTLALTYREYMHTLGLPIHMAETGKKALDLIAKHKPTVILLDLKLPDMDGIDILKKLKSSGSDARTIIITAHGSVTVAVEAMRQGATDFLLKPFNADRIITTVKNALELHRLANLVEKFESLQAKKFGRFIGDSPAMLAVYQTIQDCAPSKASVFITGPSGTGKELCAEAIHQTGPRKNHQFVALNCAAIPENLMESEIFGHKKGAFTGASSDRVGAAITADKGTLFLDEICEMPFDLQGKLLRFVQTGQIVPVGSNSPVDVDVRFICATNRIPWEEVEAGRFREDLYYRLYVVPVQLPSLSERGRDVIAIARSMLTSYARDEGKSFIDMDSDAEALLLSHNWPGNVRELGNIIHSAIVLNNGPVLSGEMLQRLMGPAMQRRARDGRTHHFSVPNMGNTASMPEPVIEPLVIAERRLIERAIAQMDGKVRKAAKKLEVNPSTLYRKLKEWAEEDLKT